MRCGEWEEEGGCGTKLRAINTGREDLMALRKVYLYKLYLHQQCRKYEVFIFKVFFNNIA